MITFAIITCNRFYYLKNCLDSIFEFVNLEDIDILVIDNNTRESGFDSYLSNLKEKVDVKTYGDRIPNELHRAMNYAIKYSRKKSNKYVNFIQDDYQYLSHVDFAKIISDGFSLKKEVVQIHTNFVWKYKAKKIGKISPLIINNIKWYYWHDKPPCDNGTTRISVYDRIGLYPPFASIHGSEKGYRSGEAWFANKCNGLKRMSLAEPNMSMIPDCAFVRGNSRIGRYFPPVNKYYLKPFDSEKIEKIKKMSKRNNICFIEDMVDTDGWLPDAIGRKHSKSKQLVKI